MKLNKLAASTIASVLLFGGVGQFAINAQPAQAIKSTQTTVAAKPSSLLASGSFVTTEQDHPTKGIAKIVNINGKRYLEFNRGFTTASGPKVKVVLHRRNTVPVKLRARDYITLSALKSFNGAQRYAIPDNVNLNNYKSVAIWCQRFNVTFGYAKLNKA
ncbi:DM13 domain-containing protein [Calothrix rhizosoleniae]|uniref:DM13 domain-containing protein n=1 Tax=Calothrix rhizosoleniae TaxID=888997 RepID=UPI000B497DAB|nr:DM13 domain-containing protein [Calothrix rhizosoleniae]